MGRPLPDMAQTIELPMVSSLKVNIWSQIGGDFMYRISLVLLGKYAILFKCNTFRADQTADLTLPPLLAGREE